jgi:hypothetical protein
MEHIHKEVAEVVHPKLKQRVMWDHKCFRRGFPRTTHTLRQSVLHCPNIPKFELFYKTFELILFGAWIILAPSKGVGAFFHELFVSVVRSQAVTAP